MSEFNISQALRSISSRYTPEQRAAQDELNRIGRNVLNEARAENQMARAKAQADTVIDNLKLAEQIEDPVLREYRINLFTNRLAELFAQMGNFIDAVNIASDPERKKEYQEIADAFEAGATTRCDCPDEIVVDRANGREFRQRSLRTVQKVINPFSRRFVAFKRCSKCGHVSAG